MEYNIKAILNIEDQNITINNCLIKYLDIVEQNVNILFNNISFFYSQKKHFILPDSNHKLALNIKKLIICGFLIMHELLNSQVLLVQADLFIKNEKIPTPDILFFIITTLNDYMKIKNNEMFINKLNQILDTMKRISSINPEYYEVNLASLKDELKINNITIEKIEENEFK